MAPAATALRRDATGIQRRVGHNLRRLRHQSAWSLQRLAAESGVSRAMLGQIELGQSAPTITVLWCIAQALGVQLQDFLASEVTQAPRD